jgi:hypothetical protein
MRKIVIAILLTIAVLYSNGENLEMVATITGKVIDRDNKPLPYVNCFLKNRPYGAMSDDSGTFSFAVPDTGSFVFTAMSMGFKTFTKEIMLKKRDSLYLNIQLENEILTADVLTISDSRIPDSEQHTISVSKMQIFLTPGGAGDVYQSLKSRPGITQVSESAELYVRGGDPSETTTLLDQGILSHPYTFESPHGGLFSMINTVLLKNADFSPGGFSVKHGNALSGILVLETDDNPSLRELTLGLSLSGLSFNGAVPIIPSKAGFRFAARKTMTHAISTFNGHDDFFVLAPQSYDINTAFCYRYNSTGKVKATIIHSSDKQAVPVQLPQYRGIFSGNSNNSLLNIQHQDILRENTLIQSAISFNLYQRRWQLGVLDFSQADKITTFRTDVNTQISNHMIMRYGLEFYQNNIYFDGKVPKYEYDMRPDADAYLLDNSFFKTRYGGYGESEIKWARYYALLGVRTDYMPHDSGLWYDPRLAAGFRFNDNTYLQLNGGIFQQAPSTGGSALRPMKAVHTTLTFHTKPLKSLTVDLALYHKQYSRLPQQLSYNHYNSRGYGFAYGFDSELKYQSEKIRGWLSYCYLESKRLWKDFTQLSPSPFAITHSLTLITTMELNNSWQVGCNFKTATGRPFTPIIGAAYDNEHEIYIPQYDNPNSQRFPPYYRLDFRLLYLKTLFEDMFTVFYLEAMNLLNIANTFDYSYTADYQSRSAIKSFFSRRTIVFGINITL